MGYDGGEHQSDERKRGRLISRDGFAACGFLTPWVLGLTVFTLAPIVASLYLSLTQYNVLSTPQWSGLANYEQMFRSDPRFLQSLRVTILYVIISVPCLLAFALGLAMLLNRGLRGLTSYRALFYLPSLLGSSAAIAVLWRQVFGQTGIVNQMLGFFHIQGPIWIGDPGTSLYTLAALNVWTFGATMVIFLAGLRQIPREMYEAAEADGANKIRQFWHMTIPMLSPIIFFNWILATIHALQSFTPAYIISGGSGGPADSMLLYSLYLYQQGFINFDMGYAAAMAWFLLVVIAAFTGLAFFTARFWVFYGDQG